MSEPSTGPREAHLAGHTMASRPGAGSLAESRYGWVLAGLGAVSIGFEAGIFLANALFLVVIADDTGWPRTTISGAISLFVLGNAIWSPVVGWLIQRHGARRTMSVGAVVLAAALTVLSLARSPVEMALVMLLLLSPGVVTVGTLANYAAIQGWFQRRRGTALALADAGSGLGGLVVVPLVVWLLGGVGWRGTYRALALIALLLGLVHLAIQRPAPIVAEPGEAVTTRPLPAARLLRTWTFWLVALGLLTNWFSLQLVSVHQAAYLADAGFAPATIGAALALTGGVGIGARLGFGWLSDRIGTAPAFSLVTVALLLAFGCLVVAGQSGLLSALWLFAIFIGLGFGVGTLLYARRSADLFGSRSFGAAWGLASLCASVGGAGGAAAGGVVREVTGSYLAAIGGASAAAVLSLGCMWLLERRAGQAGRYGGDE